MPQLETTSAISMPLPQPRLFKDEKRSNCAKNNSTIAAWSIRIDRSQPSYRSPPARSPDAMCNSSGGGQAVTAGFKPADNWPRPVDVCPHNEIFRAHRLPEQQETDGSREAQGVSIQVAILKILASHDSGRATTASLKRDIAILATSGPEWSARMRRLAARVGDNRYSRQRPCALGWRRLANHCRGAGFPACARGGDAGQPAG